MANKPERGDGIPLGSEPPGEHSTVQSPERRDTSVSPLRITAGIVVVLAALFATLIAYITNGLLSTDEAGSHEAPLLVEQLIVAIVGLLPAGLFSRAIYRHHDLQALLWLAAGMLVYLAWGALNSASVHR